MKNSKKIKQFSSNS